MHSEFAKAASYITADKVGSLLMDVVNIPSGTGREAGVAQYFVERMQKSGMASDLQLVSENRPNAVGHLRGRGDGVSLLFTGHMDTAYYGNEKHLEGFGYGGGIGYKAQATLRDGWIWGLGANNMKSGLACALIAIEAIIKAGIRLLGDISFAGVVGEIETTTIEELQGVEQTGFGVGTRHLVTHGVSADFAVLAEPTGMRIATANMGCIWLRITVEGTLANSALTNNPKVINSITVMHELQKDLMQWKNEYQASRTFKGEQPNMTFAAMRAGSPSRLGRNPRSCSLYLDIRTVPGQTMEGVKRDLRRVLRAFAERTGRPEPEMHIYVNAPPLELDENLPVVGALGEAQQAVTGSAPGTIIRRLGADAVHLTAYGVPCVSFGPGGRVHPEATSMQASGEHVSVDDLVATARIYLATALDLCSRRAS